MRQDFVEGNLLTRRVHTAVEFVEYVMGTPKTAKASLFGLKQERMQRYVYGLHAHLQRKKIVCSCC